MTWADALPNLLIGLREGLEAGLVVSILLAALRKAEAARAAGADGPPQQRRLSSAPVWLGVTGAVAVSGSFAAVLTFSTSVLSSQSSCRLTAASRGRENGVVGSSANAGRSLAR
jgi:high-affinity iron transporter